MPTLTAGVALPRTQLVIEYEDCARLPVGQGEPIDDGADHRLLLGLLGDEVLKKGKTDRAFAAMVERHPVERH